ncbi:MAG: pilus assembly PilX N-terminal domain-containing protein [Thermoanaerobaculia bacterium]|nr:pilus assembly PilX N-terminal domain-containing protein [Thermoanaerobaculia bacterium]
MPKKPPQPGRNLKSPGSGFPPTERRYHRGNAYLVTVMVMIIVMLLGLSLGTVTQTEMLIGSRERNHQRMFYLAEGGLHLAVARLLVSADPRAARLEWVLPPAYDFTSEGGSRGLSLRGVVRLAPVKSPSALPCQLCSQGALEYQTDWQTVRLPVTVRGEMESEGGRSLARRRVSSLLDVMPWSGELSVTGPDLRDADIEFN